MNYEKLAQAEEARGRLELYQSKELRGFHQVRLSSFQCNFMLELTYELAAEFDFLFGFLKKRVVVAVKENILNLGDVYIVLSVWDLEFLERCPSNSLPKLVNLLSSTAAGADEAAVVITTTDLVSKSVAIKSEVLSDGPTLDLFEDCTRFSLRMDFV
ncbi:hypothetical protein AgCh_008860 [Apium graveolens]